MSDEAEHVVCCRLPVLTICLGLCHLNTKVTSTFGTPCGRIVDITTLTVVCGRIVYITTLTVVCGRIVDITYCGVWEDSRYYLLWCVGG